MIKWVNQQYLLPTTRELGQCLWISVELAGRKPSTDKLKFIQKKLHWKIFLLKHIYLKNIFWMAVFGSVHCNCRDLQHYKIFQKTLRKNNIFCGSRARWQSLYCIWIGYCQPTFSVLRAKSRIRFGVDNVCVLSVIKTKLKLLLSAHE